MNWDDLRFVLEVARTGSFVGAAKALRVSHTTVARRLQALEQGHGTPLFERRGSRYRPTLVARGLIDLAAEMDARVKAVERQLEAQAEEPRVEGEVRIATADGLAERLGPQLAAFRARYPELKLVVTVSNEMVSLAGGDADVAIRITREPPERLVGRRLTDVRFAVYGAKKLLPQGDVDWHALPWVCLDDTRASTPQARWEATHVDDASVVFRTNARALFVDVVKRGMGVGVLPLGLADDGLEPLSGPIESLTLPVWILTHADLRRSPRIRAVMDFFAGVIDAASEQM